MNLREAFADAFDVAIMLLAVWVLPKPKLILRTHPPSNIIQFQVPSESSRAREGLQFKELVKERQVQMLVVGLPYTMQGELGTQAKQTQKFARRLSEALNLPVEFVDERTRKREAAFLAHSRYHEVTSLPFLHSWWMNLWLLY